MVTMQWIWFDSAFEDKCDARKYNEQTIVVAEIEWDKVSTNVRGGWSRPVGDSFHFGLHYLLCGS